MKRSIWGGAPKSTHSETSQWVLQSDLWLNMLAVFIVLIGGGEIMRQLELEQQEGQETSSEERPRVVIFVRSHGIQLEQGASSSGSGYQPRGAWHPHDTLRNLIQERVDQHTEEGLLVVLDCPEELPTKYLTQCLGELSDMKNITPLLR